MVKLNIPERLALIQILPKKGSFLTLQLIKSILDKITITPEEIDEYEIKENGNQIQWNEKGNIPKEFNFSNSEIELISKQLKELDLKNELELKHYTLYSKFVIGDINGNSS